MNILDQFTNFENEINEQLKSIKKLLPGDKVMFSKNSNSFPGYNGKEKHVWGKYLGKDGGAHMVKHGGQEHGLNKKDIKGTDFTSKLRDKLTLFFDKLMKLHDRYKKSYHPEVVNKLLKDLKSAKDEINFKAACLAIQKWLDSSALDEVETRSTQSKLMQYLEQVKDLRAGIYKQKYKGMDAYKPKIIVKLEKIKQLYNKYHIGANDAEDIKEIAKLVKQKKYKKAYSKASNLDTFVRDSIGVSVWNGLAQLAGEDIDW